MSLAADDLTIRLGGRDILRHLQYVFTAGKRTAIIGSNGAGKTTFLRALAGIYPCFAGQVLLDGNSVKSYAPKTLARKLALLPQNGLSLLDITVMDMVQYGRFPYHSWHQLDYRQDDKVIVASVLEKTHLQQLSQRRLGELSGGERQRVWLAMVLAQQPDYLLLDEPTTYLDIYHQLEIMQIITELHKKEGLTIVMVLHDLNQVLQYADEVVVLHEGGIFASGRPPEILTAALLAEVFGIRAEILSNSLGREVLSVLGTI